MVSVNKMPTNPFQKKQKQNTTKLSFVNPKKKKKMNSRREMDFEKEMKGEK